MNYHLIEKRWSSYIEWPEKNLPLPPMWSMRSGVLTGFSSVANDDFWNAKRKADICQCNRLSYHCIKRTTETSQWRRRLRRYLHTYDHIYPHTDSEKDVQVLRVEQRILNFVKLCAILSKH